MLEPWQKFQADFGRYLRDPEAENLPDGVVPRRAKVYEELLFNNLSGFINNCFPVCRSLHASSEWTALIRAFFRDWRCHSPRFNDIPKTFLDYLDSDISPALKYPWLTQLAHYEWIELAVDTFDESALTDTNSTLDIRVNPSLRNLVYDWPVQKIGPDFLPEQPQTTCLLVYRNDQFRVSFTEVNIATHALVNLIEQGIGNRQSVLEQLAQDMQQSFSESFQLFGLDMIDQLINQQILFGSQSQK